MEATGCRLRPLLRPLLSPPSSLIQLQLLRRLSSPSYRPSRRSRPLDEPEERGTGSMVYQHILRTQRPSTIRWRKELQNSASFIGRVNSPLKTFTSESGTLCASTGLKVEFPSGSNRISLNMWGDMAELSLQHLKENDYIYVSGYLRSFTKACDNGNIILRHKVIVKDINYIANNEQKKMEDPGESFVEKQRRRLHLWQVFFASPDEWQDLRKRKANPRQPDFVHKGTGEALWLSPYDPPWIIRQLELQDYRMGDMGVGEHLTSHSNLSPLSYDDN